MAIEEVKAQNELRGGARPGSDLGAANPARREAAVRVDHSTPQRDTIPSLELPFDRPRSCRNGQSHRSAAEFHLADSVAGALRKWAENINADLGIVLLAALEVVLFRYTRQEEIPIFTTAKTIRNGDGHGGLVLVRSKISGDATFTDFMKDLREEVRAARQSASQAEIGTPGEQAPVPQVTFAWHGPAGGGGHDGELAAEADLNVSLAEQCRGLRGRIEFNSALFDLETIERMIGHYETVIEGICADPDRALNVLPLLTTAERRQMICDWNDTDTEYPRDKRIHELFEEQVARTPDAVAVVCGERQLSYRELNERADHLAARLRKFGVGPDVCVGICLLRSLEMVVALYAVHKAGGAYVAMDPSYPAERLAFMLEDTQAPLVLTQKAIESKAPRGKAKLLCVDALPAEGEASSGEAAPINLSGIQPSPDNLAYLIYTSGSTGKPKGVMVTHRNVVNMCAGLDRVIGREPGTWLGVCSISFDLSVTEIFYTLTRGCKLLLRQDDPAVLRKLLPAGTVIPDTGSEALAKLIRRHRVTNLQCVPTLATVMLDDPALDEALRVVKTFIFGGEPLPPALVERLAGRGRIINMYGPTETTVWSTYDPVTPGGRICLGRPMANVRHYVLDSAREPLPIGVAGELFIGGLGVSRGYLNRPELTRERYSPDPFSEEPGARMYRSGDLVRYLPDGRLEFLARVDTQVKIRGHRIELGEIEAALRRHPAIQHAVVSVWQAGPNDTRLVGYFVPKDGAIPTAGELRTLLRQSLPDYMVPSAFMRLEHLPLMPNRKLDRKALPLPKPAAAASDTPEAPGNTEPTRSILKPRAAKRFEGGKEARSLPLTEAQREIWLGAQKSDDLSCTFNQSVWVRLEGPLDAALLVDALGWLVERHEALRITFPSSGEQQLVHEAMPVEVPWVDLSRDAAEERQRELDNLLREEAETPFDLVRGPLFRARLVKTAAQQHALFLTAHHLVCDGSSVAVLLEELGEWYSARAAGGKEPAPLEQTFGGFVQEQLRLAQGQERAASESFWLEQNARPTPPFRLPGVKPRTEKRKFAGALRSLRLGPGLSRKIKTLAGQQHCTLTAALLAGQYALLQRLSGQNDLLIGLAMTARSGLGSERLVGHCVNFLPLRMQCDETLSFREHLERVWGALIQAIGHQDLTLGTLLEKLEAQHGLGGLPKPAVIFNLDWVSEPIRLAGLQAALFPNPHTGCQWDLSFAVTEANDEIEVSLQYSGELFDGETIERWLRHYETLLEAMTANPAQRLSEAPPLRLPDGQIEVASAQTEAQPRALTTAAASTSDARPQTPTEETLAKIWCEVVMLEEVGRHDSFFDIGGHSLLATKVVARIAKTFGVQLPVRVIFDAPTIAELAEVITRAQQEQPARNPGIIRRRTRETQNQSLLARLSQLPEAQLEKLLSTFKSNDKAA